MDNSVKKSSLFSLSMVSLIFVSGALWADEIASETIKLKTGFDGIQVEMKVNTPLTVDKSGNTWVNKETQEIQLLMNKPADQTPAWSPNQMKPVEIPAHPSQIDNIPPKQITPHPFEESETPPLIMSKREAVVDFLSKRPDISEFITTNTGETDSVRILERWVYEVMRSSDSDWAEAKRILEELE